MKERIKMFLVDAISRKDVHPYRSFYKDDFIATYGSDVFLFLRKNHYINNPPRKNCPIWLAWKNPLYPERTLTNLLRNIDDVVV